VRCCVRSFVAMAVFLVVQPAFAGFDLRQSAKDPCVLRAFSDLLMRAAMRGRNAEVAAFLTSEDDGTFGFLIWPASDPRFKASFQGRVPPRTVAIVHTHPTFEPMPSRHDVETARRIGLPIVVITLWSLSAVDPVTGEAFELIGKSAWTVAARKQTCEPRFQTLAAQLR
jgi:proteasome lid subunit RPN8/RPN11